MIQDSASSAAGTSSPRASVIATPHNAKSPVVDVGAASPVRRDLFGGDVALVVAAGVLALGFALPQLCTVLQILLITALIMHGSAVWLPAVLMLMLTPTDFKGGGMDLQWEKFEGVTVYVLGFPLTASYAIVGAVLVRGALEAVTMPRYLAGALYRIWLLPVFVASMICVYAGLVALDARTPGWSSSARATLSLLTLWYGVSLCRDWGLFKDVMMRRLGPLCGAIVVSMFFAPVIGILTGFYLSCAAAWASTVCLGSGGKQYSSYRPYALFVIAVCLLVPVGGFRVSAAVAEASYAKMGNTTMTTMTLLMTAVAMGMGALQKRVLPFVGARQAWLIATVLFVAYTVLPFAVARFSMGKEFDTEGNVGTLRQRVLYKLFVERPAIWRGTIELLAEPPYIVVPPNRSGSLITASGQRLAFKHSSHNLVLDYLRNQGFLSGAVSLCLLYGCFVAAVVVFMSVDDPAALVAAAVFICGAMLNGLAAGHIQETGPGFMLWTCGGVCLGAVHLVRLGRTDALSRPIVRANTSGGVRTDTYPPGRLAHL